jgi:tetratricopeptide (TPR) repeat protein
MNIRKIATIIVLVFSSLAATNVAPSRSELEEMYNKAFRDFEANNFPDALKELDAIDARQPDLAESQNLRGVILMRQGIYDKAEAALQEAVRIDPKFWNARFNLAEIPFLERDWTEARHRFEQLLSGNMSDLLGEATQLIRYKILLTYLLEGNQEMVDSMLAKFELSPDTPAVHYANAAIALQRKNTKEARDWMVAAEKNFSPQLNKIFAESLYEAGWLEKPAGQGHAAVPLMTVAERDAKNKDLARSSFEQAQQAFQQRDFDQARKLIDEADAADPNQAPILNLRGEILLEQGDLDGAEVAFKKAAKADPKFREAQFNLAQIPFKKKDYTKARERFQALAKQLPGGDKNEAAQIIKFKIYMTLLLDGKESRAQKTMEQFEFTGDTPALYYAQAAWEFQHNNPNRANDWIASAKKIYSPALNNLFANTFYDLDWLQRPVVVASPTPAAETAAAMSAQTEASPAVEPSPIPSAVITAASPAKEATTRSAPTSASSPIAGMEATTSRASEPPAAISQPPVVAANESVAPGKPEEAPSGISQAFGTSSPTIETQVSAESPSATVVASAAPIAQVEQPPVAPSQPALQASAAPMVSASPVIAATPATVLAPTGVRKWSQPALGQKPHTLLIGGLLLAAMFLLAWVIVPEIRKRMVSISSSGDSVGNGFGGARFSRISVAPPQEHPATVRNHFVGGPRRVSLQLKASEPSLRRSVLPLVKADRSSTGRGATLVTGEKEAFASGAPELEVKSPHFDGAGFESSVGPVLEQIAIPSVDFTAGSDLSPVVPPIPETQEVIEEEDEASAILEEIPIAPVVVMGAAPAAEPLVEPDLEPIGQGQPIPYQMSVLASEVSLAEAVEAPSFAPPALSTEPSIPNQMPVLASEVSLAEAVEAPSFAPQALSTEPSIPNQMPVMASEPTVAETVETPSFATQALSIEPSIPQTTTPATMPEPIQIPTATRPPATAVGPQPTGAPQPAGAMHTSVQLTFSFEIASMQLTPAFKMGALQVRPISKVVTMRLAPSQQPQPAMNLQVTFEISKIQPSGGALGAVRLTPSQQQRPTAAGSPSFTVGGLQVVPNFEAAPLQLTPSQQGQASVLVTAPFQISTVEFSPSFDIASIVLNSSSKQVAVQLPSAGPVPTEGVPMFEIANVQLTPSGELGLMQLNLLGHGPRRA